MMVLVVTTVRWLTLSPEEFHSDVKIHVTLTAVLSSTLFAFAGYQFMRLEFAHQTIENILHYDALTQTLSRRHFFDLQRCIANKSAMIIMIDVDRFKEINDIYGHPVGDVVLAEIGKTLSANLGESDLVARLGGEEFIVYCPEIEEPQAFMKAETLRNKVSQLEFDVAETPLQVSISAGIARHNGGDPIDQAIVRADAMLYKAKSEGRNRVRGTRVSAPI